MKNIVISGNLGKSAEVRVAGDNKVTSFSVAVEGREGREKVTVWFDVSMWGKRGEVLAQYLTKGTKVSVSGDLGTREHNGKKYLTVKADQITLMGGGSQGNQGGYDSGSGGYDNGGAQGGQGRSAMDSDEIPF